MRKMAGEAQLLTSQGTELAFFLPGPLVETYEKTCREVQRRLVRWHGLGGTVQAAASLHQAKPRDHQGMWVSLWTRGSILQKGARGFTCQHHSPDPFTQM